jgi:poly-gamma-glutamate capsule biosynthesis protein CapA/YwtB (metallophosphatase superfamily)
LKAVRPYTIKGKILCSILEFACLAAGIFKRKKWSRPREFEENPRTMRFRDILYFAYKYYYRPPLLPPLDSDIDVFKNRLQENGTFEILATISIGGDLMPYEMIKPEYTGHLWDEVGEGFFSSDIVMANLETPIDTMRKPEFVPEVMLNHMHFNSDQTTLDIFSGNGRFKGYDILAIANNHSLDMGEKGLVQTIDHLNSRGIRTVGAKKEKEGKDHEIMEVNGVRIGFVSYTYSLNEYLPSKDGEWMVNYLPLNCADCDIDIIRAHVKACREAGADLVICSLHCGNAYQAYPLKLTTDLFMNVFEKCGVDVIAGGHPHNLQPWHSHEFTDPFNGKRKKGFAIYSLADFIAYDIFTWCHLCAYLKLEIGRDRNGEVIFNPIVIPMVMQREQGQLKLVYAANVLNSPGLKGELKDIKVLYDICMQSAK